MSDLLTFSPPHCLNSALYRLFPKLRPSSGWRASLLLFRNSFCRMGWTQSFLDARTIWLICSFFRAIKVNPLVSAEGGTLILVRDFFVKVRQDFKVSWTGKRGPELFWKMWHRNLDTGWWIENTVEFSEHISLLTALSCLWSALSHPWSILVFLWWYFYCDYSVNIRISSLFNSSFAKQTKKDSELVSCFYPVKETVKKHTLNIVT